MSLSYRNCSANQLTGFCMRGPLVVAKGLNAICKHAVSTTCGKLFKHRKQPFADVCRDRCS